MIISLILGIIEPISTAMLAHMVLANRNHRITNLAMRLFLAVLVIGMGVHTAQQWALVFDYRPPRTWAWVPVFIGVNGAIWTAFIASCRYRKAQA